METFRYRHTHEDHREYPTLGRTLAPGEVFESTVEVTDPHLVPTKDAISDSAGIAAAKPRTAKASAPATPKAAPAASSAESSDKEQS